MAEARVERRLAAILAADVAGYSRLMSADLDRIDGFISIERFHSLSDPEKLLSLSYWRDEEAVKNWRNHSKHRESQTKGRTGIFADYRLRVATVMRDCGLTERAEVPKDSRSLHDQQHSR
jgi:heme-degrading monooxygenase HmoA